MTRKYLLGIILSIFFIISTSYAGSWNGWIYQNPYPTSNTLLAVKFITPQKGWIAGAKGTILYTEDGGENWEAQDSGTEEDIKSVAFVNEKQGWAVGNGGVIIHTEDGGKMWVAQGEIKKASLNKVIFLNDKEGWAVGMNGLVLYTTDGGKKWEKQDIGIKRSIASVYFVNLQIGWILAGDEVYRTADGGKKWEKTVLPVKIEKSGKIGKDVVISGMGEGIPLDWWQGDMFFINDKKGWAVIGLWYIFYTEDGGKTWVNQLSTGYMSYGLGLIAFSDANKGCAAGSSIFCTEDGGKTWDERLSIGPGNRGDIDKFPVDLWGIDLSNYEEGWVVGINGLIAKTDNRGKSWKAKSRGRFWPYFINKTTGWFTRWDYKLNRSSIYRTDDGGDTWQVQSEFDFAVARFFFLNDSIGWVVGTQQKEKDKDGHDNVWGVIIHTADGGKTWVTQFREPIKQQVNSISHGLEGLENVFFINNKTGWVVGGNGTIIHTRDGGKHWEYQKSGTLLRLIGVRFIDTNIGLIVGDSGFDLGGETPAEAAEGIILYTDDGGQHWQTKWKKQDVLLYSWISFTDKNNMWIPGNIPGGTVLIYSNDGGKTWLDRKIQNVALELDSICFLDKGNGILFSEGLMLVTDDGGKTWNKQRRPIHRYPWHCSDIFDKTRMVK